MRGDRPPSSSLASYLFLFTPHARGSTLCAEYCELGKVVYPACAGIDLPPFLDRLVVGSLPRMRGDRPTIFDDIRTTIKFTPHARGSTTSF